MSPELRQDLTGAAILSGVFLALLGGAELWRRCGRPNPEWTRKLVHVGGGLTCLLFPFMVERLWIILALALAMTGIFTAAARLGLLASLHGVERPSRGAEYYPLAIFLVLLLAGERTWLYLAAILVLAVADAFAALVGSRYGVVRYQVQDESKTLEGSLVFLLIAFLAIHLPTLLMTDLARPVCVLAAVLVAVLVTGFEAISLRGADNLFVPMAVVVVLGKITTKPLSEVVFQNLSLLGICLGIALLVRRLPYFNVGATIAVVLYAYGNWSLGSWQWALPVFAGLLVYLLARLRSAAASRHVPPVRVRTAARALLAPFLILVLANSSGRYEALFAPYVGASAAVLAFSLVGPVFRLELVRRRPRLVGAAAAAALGCAATCLPVWLVQPVAASAPAGIAALVLAATVWILELEWVDTERPTAPEWSAARFLLCLAVGGGVYLLERLALMAPWSPLSTRP
ncbi:MAG TPA: hypothetical protein VGC93_13260 [Thermoanaerobaculia bacterium]